MAVNFGEIKRIDIVGFLERTGIRPVRNYQAYALYHAPYREDRHPFFKGTVGQKDVSLIQMGSHNDLCTVFEGFMDFLSYMTLCRRADFTPFAETMDFVVLNSVSNLRKAMKWLAPYPTVTCCLDNDDAGRRAVDTLNEARDGIHDASGVYEGYKDLNDFLRGKRFCP